MKKLILLTLCSLFTLAGAMAQRADTLDIPSPSMHKTIKAVVVTPAGYDKAKEVRYPVIYLLHGHSGSYRTYPNSVRPTLKEDATELNCIIVCPDGGFSSWYWDSPIDSTMRYETFVAKELTGYIDSHFRTVADRTGRAITGLSMGGHGGLWLGFRNPEVFGACGSMSGGVDIRPFPDQWNMKERLGEYYKNPKVWDEHTVINQIYQLRPERHVLGGRGNDWEEKSAVRRPSIIIDCGVDDFFYPVNLKLHEALLYNNIAHDFISRPGTHNGPYWKNALDYQFTFFRNYFKKEGTLKK